MPLRAVVFAVVAALVLSSTAGAATVDVDIQGSAFQPSSLTIAVGDTVRWTNRDPFLHTVTSDDGGFTSSGDLSTNGTHSFTFTTPGTYPYHCAWHPLTMKASVTVLAPGSPAPLPPPPPELRVGDRRLREGDGGTRAAVFALRLSAPSEEAVEVSFATQNGTARRRSDYRARSGRITFAPGETSKRVVVRVVSDRRDERNETFWLVLRDAVGATLVDARGRGLIVDDD